MYFCNDQENNNDILSGYLHLILADKESISTMNLTI